LLDVDAFEPKPSQHALMAPLEPSTAPSTPFSVFESESIFFSEILEIWPDSAIDPVEISTGQL